MTELRVGVDLVQVTDVEESMRRFGDRYLSRIYTRHELASCQGPPVVTSSGLAARFAAKEAVLKVLRPSGPRPPWRTIEVVRHPHGWCSIRLRGSAARLAAEAGVESMAVSLTHENDYAGAVVVASCAAR